MNKPIFPNGITGLSDTKWMGERGNAHKLVGIDFRSEPGVFKAQQKLKKISSIEEKEGETNVVTSLCDIALDVSDGSKLWFSSDNGKIWKQSGDSFSLIHTLNPATDYEEPNSVTEIINEDKIDYKATMSISENNFDYGKISATAVSFSEIANAEQIHIAHLSTNKLMMAYQGADSDGFVSAVSIYPGGGVYETNTVEFDTTRAEAISICPISDTHSFLAYRGGASSHAFVKVIAANGSVVSTLEHDTTNLSSNYSDVVKIDDTHFALVYGGGASYYAYLKIFSIDGAYAITEESSTLLEEAMPYDINIFEISAGRFIVAYEASNATKVKIIDIDGSYAVTITDTLVLSTTAEQTEHISLSKIDDTHFLIVFRLNQMGKVYSIGIDESDNLEVVDMFTITKSATRSTAIANLGDGHFFVSAQDSDGSKMYGIVVDVDDSYIITSKYEPETLGIDYGGRGNLTTLLVDSSSEGRTLYLIGGDGGYPVLCTIKMNETFSSGITLNPTTGETIGLVQSKTQSLKYSDYQYIREKIDVDSGDDLAMLVVVGSTQEDSHITSVTTNEDTMTLIDEQETPDGFACNLSYYIKTGIDAGENIVKVNYDEDTMSNTFLAILIFKNVNQATPTIAVTDSGWKNYLTMETTVKNALRVGSFLTRVNTHTHGAYDNVLATIDINDQADKFTLSISSRGHNYGTSKILGASEFSYTQPEVIADGDYDYQPEEKQEKIYYCNENILFAVPVDKIDSWADNIEIIGSFKNGDDTYHPMIKQKSELYIGDDNIIAKIDVNGIFNQETLFNIKSPERIQVLSTFDTDILVGIKDVNKAKVLRWDTLSQFWSAGDDVWESGINAFIKDDNYTYISAGDYGNLYFYNGEKLTLTKRIPGNWNTNNLIDSYSKLNYDYDIEALRGSYWSQSFTVKNPGILDSIQFYLSVTGALTGNITAKIYDMTGTIGTNGVPIGLALATSDNLDISTLTSTPTLTKFTFSGINKISLIDKNYCIVLYNSYDFTPENNYLKIGCKEVGTYNGDVSSSPDAVTWIIGNPKLTYSMIFYINSDLIKTAIVNPNATDYYMGTPVFGLSNSTGNTALQGVYGFGAYDDKYIKGLSLDFPVPTGELYGVQIGAILVNGADMYVSYKTADDVGIAKIDYSNKYNGAYLETMQLTSLIERDDDSIVERIVADYVSMPDDTSIAISTKTKYDTTYTAQDLIVDEDKMSVRTKNNIPKISSLQVKLQITTSENDSPKIENLGLI